MLDEARFWSKVKKTDGCWLWLGHIRSDGYGSYGNGAKGRGSALAHQIAFRLTLGRVPDGLELDHRCRVRECVNPAHLEPVTHRENILRGTAPAALHAQKTHCPQGHPYSPENTYIRGVRGGGQVGARVCRTCAIERTRRNAERKRAS